MTDRVVPVAYVTKWVKSVGIVTWAHAMETDGGFLYVDGNIFGPSVSAKHWTESKPIAEARWRDAVKKEAKRLKAAAEKYEALSKGAPVYAKEEG